MKVKSAFTVYRFSLIDTTHLQGVGLLDLRKEVTVSETSEEVWGCQRGKVP